MQKSHFLQLVRNTPESEASHPFLTRGGLPSCCGPRCGKAPTSPPEASPAGPGFTEPGRGPLRGGLIPALGAGVHLPLRGRWFHGLGALGAAVGPARPLGHFVSLPEQGLLAGPHLKQGCRGNGDLRKMRPQRLRLQERLCSRPKGQTQEAVREQPKRIKSSQNWVPAGALEHLRVSVGRGGLIQPTPTSCP